MAAVTAIDQAIPTNMANKRIFFFIIVSVSIVQRYEKKCDYQTIFPFFVDEAGKRLRGRTTDCPSPFEMIILLTIYQK
jgi:hypothetical protein